jgi:GNAT superfamily N-acetyltransferase
MDPKTITLRTHRPGDIGWVIHRQATAYAQEYGYNTDFEALVAKVAADFLLNFNPARERCWIAESAAEPPDLAQPVGHIFLVQHPDRPTVAKLRLLMVEPTARGTGLGTMLVNECIAFARQAGYYTITLWTQSDLHAARKIYQKAGFHLVHEERHQSFGKDLIGQTWELDLNPPPPGEPSHISIRG